MVESGGAFACSGFEWLLLYSKNERGTPEVFFVKEMCLAKTACHIRGRNTIESRIYRGKEEDCARSVCSADIYVMSKLSRFTLASENPTRVEHLAPMVSVLNKAMCFTERLLKAYNSTHVHTPSSLSLSL